MQQASGWVALGFGQHMTHTHSVIMWKNADGTTTMSQRYTTQYREPEPVSAPPRVATLVKPKGLLAYPKNVNSFAFQVSANKTLLSSSQPEEQLVFAYSPVTPDKDAASSLARHMHVGYLTFDLTKDFVPQKTPVTQHPKVDQGTNKSYKRVEKFIILHGFLVSVGFLVLLPAGSLIGRYGRAFTPKWFKFHRLSNFVIAGPVITLGVLLGPVVVFEKASFRIHFANTHEIFGLVLLLLYYAQVLLGRYIHNRRNQLAKLGPITRPHPPLNILHIICGVSIITLAFFQVRSGLTWWETLTGRGPIASWALPLWKAWCIILPLAYFGGYALLPRQLRQEREAAYTRVPGAAEEARAEGSHLLADEEDRS